METEATQQGVSRRERDLEALVKKRSDERNEELGIKETVSEADDIQEEGQEDLPEIEMLTFTGADGKTYDVPKDSRLKLKIDGEEIESPLDQVTRRYQKGAAGDKRLQEANSIKQQLEAKEAALSQREQAFLAKMQEAQQAREEGDLSKDDHNELTKKLISALVEADEDAAAELLPKLFQKNESPAIDPEIIEKRVEERVERKLTEREKIARANDYERKRLEANDRFEKEFPELTESKDKFLYQLVGSKAYEIQSQRPDADPWEIISEAAQDVHAWNSTRTKQSSRKRSVPTPASGRASIGKDEKPQTRAEILSNMKAARGQPV